LAKSPENLFPAEILTLPAGSSRVSSSVLFQVLPLLSSILLSILLLSLSSHSIYCYVNR